MAAHSAVSRVNNVTLGINVLPRSRNTASRSMMTVPITVRMSSGKILKYSTPEGMKLTGIGHLLRRSRRRFDLLLGLASGLSQCACVRCTDGRQEALRVYSHPNHQNDHR